MKYTISFYQFQDAWKAHNREDSFSTPGKQALFDYFEELTEELGETIELDIIAIDSEYAEYASLKELQESYPDIESMDDLREHTLVIDIPDTNGFIIQQY